MKCQNETVTVELKNGTSLHDATQPLNPFADPFADPFSRNQMDTLPLHIIASQYSGSTSTSPTKKKSLRRFVKNVVRPVETRREKKREKAVRKRWEEEVRVREIEEFLNGGRREEMRRRRTREEREREEEEVGDVWRVG